MIVVSSPTVLVCSLANSGLNGGCLVLLYLTPLDSERAKCNEGFGSSECNRIKWCCGVLGILSAIGLRGVF